MQHTLKNETNGEAIQSVDDLLAQKEWEKWKEPPSIFEYQTCIK